MKEQDTITRFLFEDLSVRGEWMKLTQSWHSIISNHDYSELVQQQLGEAVAASVLLATTIKFEGSLILQAQGEGPLTAVIAQCTHERFIRALARSSGGIEPGSLMSLYGNGRLVLTIEPDSGQPYQGITELKGENLAQALENYYAQSEQLKTRLWLFANGQHVAGLMLQELPAQQGSEAGWQHIEMLADTVTEQEIMELSCQQMLYRLFNEEQVRVFKPEPVQNRCSCSIAKIEITLISLGRDALEEMLRETNEITVDCEFCNQQYTFDAVDIGKLLVAPDDLNASNVQH